MKILLSAALLSLSLIQSASAATRNYSCIARNLEAISSNYAGLTEADIDSMITIPEYAGHIDAVRAEKVCEANTQYTCIANILRYQGFTDVSPATIDAMLTIPEFAGHIEARNAAKACAK